MLWELMQKGGLLMIPLLAFSVVALGLILERLFFFSRQKNVNHAWFEELTQNILAERGERNPYFQKSATHPIQIVLAALWRHRDLSPNDLQALAQEEAENQHQELERNLKPLAVIAILSPLLGLLGTVLGIMKAFHQTAQAAQVDPTLLAGGIWEALITTFAGLAIAIPVWLTYYYFESRVNRLGFQMEFYSSRFIRILKSLKPRENAHSPKISLSETV